MEDLAKRIVLKRGRTYLFPNFQRVPTEVPMSEKKLIRKFSKEEEEFAKKMIAKFKPLPKQQDTTVIDYHEDEKAETVDQIEEWGNWKPPQVSPENKNIQINVGLRQTRQGTQS
ncbi:hypothetical protein O181_077818 [Austropuccinia psidii MF-1]|uniref:Uncharacterized protein n=1 Tax=Austropuccinia psidii MF-1 TaxID=1389203 RepID=A0A9Q3IE26_9BASI|nr:hypothetical protein [Austropuccinia psidii MF-1]